MRSFSFLVLLLSLLITPRIYSLAEIGDAAPALCWKNYAAQSVCLEDYRGEIAVLIYTVGWCQPAQAFMDELSQRVQEFQNQPVTFFSLSASGWESSTLPTSAFLREWQAEYAIPFPVLASPRDPGRDFFEQPLVPNAVILDQEHKVRFKKIAPGVSELLEEVRRLLSKG